MSFVGKMLGRFVGSWLGSTGTTDETTGKGGGWQTPLQRDRIESQKRAQVKKAKSEIEKLDSVLRENERRAAVAAQNKVIATSTERAIELAALERQYLEEINRLLMVRVELVRRIREAEQVIIAIVVMRKRRLRLAA